MGDKMNNEGITDAKCRGSGIKKIQGQEQSFLLWLLIFNLISDGLCFSF